MMELHVETMVCAETTQRPAIQTRDFDQRFEEVRVHVP